MTSPTTQPAAAIPPDDANRKLTVADPDDPKLRHVSVAGGTYTILVSGEQTGGRYCLIDMLVPAGGGPPPHRHDFEEMFTILDGEIELTFRGEVQRALADYEELLGDGPVASPSDEEMHRTEDFGGLSQHRSRANRSQHIGTDAQRRIRRNPGERIRAAAV